MPGIVGLQTRMPRGWAEAQLKVMVECLQHESFYIAGTWVDESLGLYVGWIARRNSFSEDMPLRNENGNLTLIFSGEDFSDPEFDQDRSASGVRNMVSPFSYLVRRAESETNFPCGLNGRFHGLLADRMRGTTTLVNDRYAMHRLYYHQAKEGFYFAAEAKAILAVRPELRRIDPRSFGEYVTCGCVLENRTLFDKIKVLPGGSRWVLKNGGVAEKGTYFHPREWEEQEVLEPESYYQELRGIFSRNLPRYFHSRGKIGVSLTGGLDTRMIMAWHQAPTGSLPCYTFGGRYRDCQDVVVARKIARACGQPHQVIQVGQEFFAGFSHYAERTVYLTDGCADVRRASDLYLNELAREIAPVRMTGNYGSEVLRAVRAFKPDTPMPGLFTASMYPYFAQAQTTYGEMVHEHPLSFAVFRQAPWHHYGLLALEETQVAVRSPYLDNEFVQTVFRAPRSTFASPDLCLRLIMEGNAALREIPTDTGIGGAGLTGAISRRVFEFLKKAEYAYDYGMPQWVAQIDHCLSWAHLETLFLGRHKFNHYRVWYRDVLAGYVRQILLDSRTLSRPYLDRKMVETIVHGHLRGHHNYTTEIHCILSLELLHRLFMDS